MHGVAIKHGTFYACWSARTLINEHCVKSCWDLPSLSIFPSWSSMSSVTDSLHDSKTLCIFENELDPVIRRKVIESEMDVTGCTLDLLGR